MPEQETPGARTETGDGPAWLRKSIAPKLRLAAKESRAFFEEELGRSGASFAAWTVLATLTLEGPMIQRTLAKYLSIEGPTLSRHLETMERRGLVVRTRDGADRRAAVVALTDEGRSRYVEIEAVALRSQERMLEGLSDADVVQLGELLGRIRDNVKPG
ncbi:MULTISPECIES: MarR family winged helix-turn-helix transcriptional regulator [unclassified Streptomyces]|uniref:MarR family winged helix-turn-helix transcriptional regulator n=1 Tax=unclassified Streptomyces TaxID=2593676 RepID=UPI002E176E4D|nr:MULTISPECIES: MarR family transcriptional regulator [unclassified Streptomyces]